MQGDSPEADSESGKDYSPQDDSLSVEIVEPKLKYKRLLYDVPKILQRDTVSCVAFDSKIIYIGTHWGSVHILDHEGNSIYNEHLRGHSVTVNQISLDAKGDFIATCSDDGRAYVYSLYSFDHGQELCVGRCIKSIAIDPNYYKLGFNRRFVTGDDRLILHEKTFLSRTKSTTLYESVGKVHNIKWRGRFIAWACDAGIRIYDIVNRMSLGLIKCNEYVSPKKYPCCLCWKNKVTLLIGWVDTVRVVKIEKRISVIKDVPEFVVTEVLIFQRDYIVCGICPLELSQMIVLAYSKEKDENNKALQPQMYTLQAEGNEFVTLHSDRLKLPGYQDYLYNDYHLECLVDENRFVIACPKDIVIATMFSLTDRIDWLSEHKKFEEAMCLVMTDERVQRTSMLVVGKKYLEFLLNAGQYAKAAKLCSEILSNDKQLWETAVFKFARVQQLRAISNYLPIDLEHRLDPHIYEIVLYEYLKIEPENFLNIIKKWPPDLYNINAVINAVQEQVEKNSMHNNILLESLAMLYKHSKQYEKAVCMYLEIKQRDVFQLIYEQNLSTIVHHNIEKLIDVDADQAINMFLDKKFFISPDLMVKRLQHNQYYLFLYLDMLDTCPSSNIIEENAFDNTPNYKDFSRKYHAQLVELYARFAQDERAQDKHARDKLLSLLRRSNTYPIQKALKICKELNLDNETVYLLDRIGKSKEALQLLMEKIGDIEQAILFCKEHNDDELWKELVNHSLSNAEFLSYLLQKIGNHVNPTILVERIDKNMKIPGLKNSLVKMLHDYSLQVTVKEGCKNIVVSDCFNLYDKLVKLQLRGIIVDDDLRCSVCNQKVLVKNNTNKNNILVFYCHHSFHEGCLPIIGATQKCIICYSH